ncbi:MAG: helix-turn-helix domain-containing protein [Candidatus Izimaplasma sp.]|nr:helix-turn-helix domain-containing protein [Candidatus Izimaplasma bacterium]
MTKTKLKELRIEKQMTQKELSELSGVPQEQISRYERGRSMTEETIKKIVKALNVNADYFLGLTDKNNEKG